MSDPIARELDTIDQLSHMLRDCVTRIAEERARMDPRQPTLPGVLPGGELAPWPATPATTIYPATTCAAGAQSVGSASSVPGPVPQAPAGTQSVSSVSSVPGSVSRPPRAAQSASSVPGPVPQAATPAPAAAPEVTVPAHSCADTPDPEPAEPYLSAWERHAIDLVRIFTQAIRRRRPNYSVRDARSAALHHIAAHIIHTAENAPRVTPFLPFGEGDVDRIEQLVATLITPAPAPEPEVTVPAHSCAGTPACEPACQSGQSGQ